MDVCSESSPLRHNRSCVTLIRDKAGKKTLSGLFRSNCPRPDAQTHALLHGRALGPCAWPNWRAVARPDAAGEPRSALACPCLIYPSCTLSVGHQEQVYVAGVRATRRRSKRRRLRASAAYPGRPRPACTRAPQTDAFPSPATSPLQCWASTVPASRSPGRPALTFVLLIECERNAVHVVEKPRSASRMVRGRSMATRRKQLACDIPVPRSRFFCRCPPKNPFTPPPADPMSGPCKSHGGFCWFEQRPGPTRLVEVPCDGKVPRCERSDWRMETGSARHRSAAACCRACRPVVSPTLSR